MSLLRGLLLVVGSVLGLLLLLPAALLLAPLVIVAWLTRMLSRVGVKSRETVPWQELIEFDPELGWRPKPDLDVYGRADDEFHLTTGSDGWRGTIDFDDADVVVLGDSFAFGHGADDDQMFTAFSGDVAIKPIGCNGYDMVQEVLCAERFAHQLHGKLVVWMPFYGNDLMDSLLPAMGPYRKPFLRRAHLDESWQIVTDHVWPEPWLFPFSGDYQSALGQICTEGSDLQIQVADACLHLVDRLQAVCRDAGAEVVVLGIPERIQLTKRGRSQLRDRAGADECFDATLPDRMFSGSCDRVGVRFIPLSQHLGARDYLIQDVHWRRSGHRKVGSLLGELIRERSQSKP